MAGIGCQVGRCGEDAVTGDLDGAGAELGWGVLHHAIFVRRGLVDDGELAFPVRDEDRARSRIVGGAVGAFAVFLLTLVYRKLTWAKMKIAVMSTLEVSCMILLLVAASNYFGAVFSRLGSATLIAETLLTLNFSPTVMLLIMLAIIFLLGWPLEWVPIVLIVVPIFLPLVNKLGIDLVWFCTLVAVCLQTAWLSPPVALSAYFLKGVVPDWDLKDIYAGMMQFMVLQIVGLLLILVFPQIALWLPAYLRE